MRTICGKLLAVVFCTVLCGLVTKGTVAVAADRWDKQRIRDYPIYSLLIKARSAGSGVPEVVQWTLTKEKGEEFRDPKRIENLKKLLEEYPDSEYADDAALLMARCRFLYDDDPNGAIEGLYEVVETYPKATGASWIAEDRLFLRRAVLSNMTKRGEPRQGWYGGIPTKQQLERIPEDRGRAEWEKVRAHMEEELAYFNYVSEKPNWTEDEARYWIAWIIMEADLDVRIPEAEKVLRKTIEARKTERRTEMDRRAADERTHGVGITRYMQRTERRSHRLLIDLLLAQGKPAESKAEAAEYARLHEGHGTVKMLVRKGLITSDGEPAE